jgi:hypothetical protein
MPQWHTGLHDFLINGRPSLHSRIQGPLSSAAKESFKGEDIGYYSTVYQQWTQSLDRKAIIANNRDPFRYLHPWLQYKTYDLMAETRLLGNALDDWGWNHRFDADERCTLNCQIDYIEDSLHELEELFKTARKVAMVTDIPMSQELGIVFDFYNDAATEAKGLVQMISRRMQHYLTEISIDESQKSIREAGAVKRLTQLAFLFVPLSFATSIFGMNIEELSGVGPRIWVFLITAICLIVAVFFFWKISRIIDAEETNIFWMKGRRVEFISYYLAKGRFKELFRIGVLLALLTSGRYSDRAAETLDSEFYQNVVKSRAS